MKQDPLEKAVERAAFKNVMDLAREQERERCARIAETEPEPDGPMPIEFSLEQISEIVKATVRATRKCIADRIRTHT